MPNYINRYLRLMIWPEGINEPVTFKQDWKIAFRVRKCASATFMSYNTAEISVYNMTSDLQNVLSRTGLAVRMIAGYDSMHDTIFVGTIYNVTTIKQSTEIITTFYCVSNTMLYEDPINECVNNISVKDLIVKLCKDHGISFTINTSRKDIVQKSYTGPLSKVLAKICSEYDIVMCLDNGKLSFKDENADITNEPVAVITPNSGMLGSPSVTEVGIRFKSLMQPSLQVNDYFRLEAPYANYNLNSLSQAPGLVAGGELNVFAHIDTRNYSGVYRALSIVETGDTRGNSWYTEVEGSRI